MAIRGNAKADLVREYVEKYAAEIKSGKLKKAQLARWIHKDHPTLFKHAEQVRDLVRHVTGAHSIKSKKTNNALKKVFEHHGNSSNMPVPKSEARPLAPYKINKPGQYLVFSDVHLPYHDEHALHTMFAYTNKKKYAGIIILGDLVDNYKASRFMKIGHKPDLHFEYEMVRDFLKRLNELFKVPVYWKFGNHDVRMELYMHQQIPELSQYVNLFVDSIFNLKPLGVEKIPGHQEILLGKLLMVHGHEFMTSAFSPVNPARGLFLRAKTSAMFGHHHQSSEHTEGNLKGERISCWSLGCLCTLRPEYSPMAFTKWNHGFAEVRLEKDGTYQVDNHRIINGKVR